jgi:hypothetical protein
MGNMAVSLTTAQPVWSRVLQQILQNQQRTSRLL